MGLRHRTSPLCCIPESEDERPGRLLDNLLERSTARLGSIGATSVTAQLAALCPMILAGQGFVAHVIETLTATWMTPDWQLRWRTISRLLRSRDACRAF